MKNLLRIGSMLMLYLFASSVWAQTTSTSPDQTQDLLDQFKQISQNINADLVKPALITASAALMLQWVASHWKELFSADLTSLLVKGVGVISWFGGSVWLLQNQALLSGMFTQYLNLAGKISGIGDSTGFDPGDIMSQCVVLIENINTAFNKAAGFTVNPLEIGANMVLAFMLLFSNILTFLCFLVVALSVFVAQAEFWLMFSVAPLAFALIPLSAFRDQGIAPIKGLMSLGLRLIILGVIVKITGGLTDNLSAMLLNNPGSKAHFFAPFWYYFAGMAATAIMAFSAGKIASSIASGSASFSGADAVKGGMQLAATAGAGAAVGAAIGGAVSSAATKGAGVAADGIKSAASAMGKMMGGGANNLGVSNAGPSAGGPGKIGGPLPKDPSIAAEKAFNAGQGQSPSMNGPTPSSGASGNSPGGANKSGAGPTANSSGIAMDAGISGAPSDEKSSAQDRQSNKGGSSLMDHLGKAAEHTSQDNHAVSVSINTRGE